MALTSYSEVNCIISEYLRTGRDADNIPAEVWSVSFKPDQNTAWLFPYINGAQDDALWYEQPDHVRFLLDGRRCLLYPDRAAAHFFDSREAAMAFIRPMMDFLNDLDRRKGEIEPNYKRIRHIQVMDILKLLPGSNCRDCGFASCMAFAAAVARGRATADLCPDLSQPMSESAVYPLLDRDGNLVSSLSLNIDTASLKQRIREQALRIKQLEDERDRAVPPRKNSQAIGPKSLGPAVDPPMPVSPLTDRETQVLGLIAQGYTNNEIASLLFISPHTVKSHMINIFNKFSVSDRTQAAVLGVRSGLI